jgi:hypothetical protein
MEQMMTEMNGEPSEIRDLIPTEIDEISGGMNNMGPLMAAGAVALRFMNDINLQFYGCVIQGDTRTCVYSYELP